MNSKQTMTGRIIRAVSAGALGQVINVGGRLLLIPLFLLTWGAEVYGEWLILSSLVAWLALGDLGGQVYFINRLTTEWGHDQLSAFQRTWSTALVAFLVFPALLWLGFVALIEFTSLAQHLGVVVTPSRVANLSLLILSLQIALSLPQGLLLGLYRSFGLQATSMMLANMILFLQLSISAVVLITDGTMLDLALFQTIPIVVIMLYAIFDLQKKLPQLELLKLSKFDGALMKKAFSPSLHFLGIQMAQALVVQGSVLAVAKTLGAVDVALFSSLRTIANTVRQLLALLSHSVWPEFTRLEAAQKYQELSSLLMALLRFSLACMVAVAFVLQVAGTPLFELWLQNHLIYKPELMKELMIYTALVVAWTLPANLLMATNSHIHLARAQLFIAAVAVVACFIGAKTAGLNGAVWGLLALDGASMWLLVIYLVTKAKWAPSAGQLLMETMLCLAAIFLSVWPLVGFCLVLILFYRSLYKLRFKFHGA